MSYRRAYERNRRLKNKCHTHKCIWYDEEQNKYYLYSPHIKSIKQECRRITRRRLNASVAETATNERSLYKKEFDYWWTID